LPTQLSFSLQPNANQPCQPNYPFLSNQMPTNLANPIILFSPTKCQPTLPTQLSFSLQPKCIIMFSVCLCNFAKIDGGIDGGGVVSFVFFRDIHFLFLFLQLLSVLSF
jgi:hypothetical protein